VYLKPPSELLDEEVYSTTLENKEYVFTWIKNGYDKFWYLSIHQSLTGQVKCKNVKVVPGKILAEFSTGNIVCISDKLNYPLHNGPIAIQWNDRGSPAVIDFRDVNEVAVSS